MENALCYIAIDVTPTEKTNVIATTTAIVKPSQKCSSLSLCQSVCATVIHWPCPSNPTYIGPANTHALCGCEICTQRCRVVGPWQQQPSISCVQPSLTQSLLLRAGHSTSDSSQRLQSTNKAQSLCSQPVRSAFGHISAS